VQTNHLIGETSPYLLQHAHNPVEWYPWGEEALERARRENKPILLSIGYSACHWCHVMEHESFENEEIAALMNEHFINIKVDREERPDLDEVYMNAVQMLTGRGGWPMTVFLTPEGKPFFGGTYFPPEDRYGVQGFPRVLKAVAQVYREKPDQVALSGQRIVEGLQRMNSIAETQSPFSPETGERAVVELAGAYDHEHGGLGRAPKFPNTGVLAFFLRHHRRTGEGRTLEMATHTLNRMALGGIYDHLGGGFHRYSVDERWLVPHFEKMLYDNAQLLHIYSDAYRVTGEPLFKRVVEETLAYLLREMAHPEGGFYSTQDADSEGEEGKYYVWEQDEVEKILGRETAAVFSRVYDVSEVGNFEGKCILHPVLTLEQAAKYFKREPGEVAAVLGEAREKLLAAREKRVKPFRDDKILASWNGLMLTGVAAALKITADPSVRDAAEKTVAFLVNKMAQGESLLHCWKDGKAKIRGFLDDYAYVAAGLLDLYETTLEPGLFERSLKLTERMVGEFWDEAEGGFFTTGKSHAPLVSRSKPAFDGSVPSGNSVATQLLLRIHHYTGRQDYLERAEKVLKLYYDAMEKHPFGMTEMLSALDLYLRGPTEVFFVGPRGDAVLEEMLVGLHSVYLPGLALKLVEPGRALESASPLLRGKTQVEGKPTVYVCRNYTCSPPVTHWEGLKEVLKV